MLKEFSLQFALGIQQHLAIAVDTIQDKEIVSGLLIYVYFSLDMSLHLVH